MGEGPSLNDCLYSGTKFDQNILDIVLRFCAYKVAVVANVEKAFVMARRTEVHMSLRSSPVLRLQTLEPTKRNIIGNFMIHWDFCHQ